MPRWRAACRRMALTDTNGLYGLVWFLQYAAEQRPAPDRRGRAAHGNGTRGPAGAQPRRVCRPLPDHFPPAPRPGFRSAAGAAATDREHLFVLSDQICRCSSALREQNGTASALRGIERSRCRAAAARFLPARNGIPVAATNDVYFVDPHDFALHRLLRAIDLNTCLSRIPPEELASADRWLKPPEEMARRYPHLPARAGKHAEDRRRLFGRISISASRFSRISRRRTGRTPSSI